MSTQLPIASITSPAWFTAPRVGKSATFTVSNSEKHFTFKIKAQTDKKDDTKKVLFVSVMTGSDNENSFTYMGILNQSTLKLHATRNSKITEDDQRFKAFVWSVKMVACNTLPEGYKVQHEGRCGRCGRKLTNPESIAIGLGPECAGNI